MKLDRMLGILTVLLRQGTVTAPQLAERFEVSRRTISRDIDALCQAGIPVVTRQGGGGGISIAEGYRLESGVLTGEEFAGLVAALKGIGSVSEDGGRRALEKLGGDVAVSLRESVVIDLSSHYRGNLTGKIARIKEAVRDLRPITFDYYYEKGISHRCVEPYFVVFQWAAWYVFGFCRDRQDWRMFKLQRLWNLALLDGRYALRDIPPDRRDFSACLPDRERLVAVFAPSERYRLIETYGLDCYTEQSDGWLRLEAGYTRREHILRWLLGFGAKARVLFPPDLAEEIRQIAREMADG